MTHRYMVPKQQQRKPEEDTPLPNHNISMSRLMSTGLLLIAVSLLTTQAFAQAPQIQAHTAYQIIPEGEAAVISFEPSTITAGESVTLDLSIEGADASQASLSPEFITLSSTTPKAQVIVTVDDKEEKQGDALSFMIGFTPVSYTHLTLPTKA